MACTTKQLPQVMVSIKDPDTIIHGAHEFRRVENARRWRHADGSETCGGCGASVGIVFTYCPYCGRKLQNPEEGDWA